MTNIGKRPATDNSGSPSTKRAAADSTTMDNETNLFGGKDDDNNTKDGYRQNIFLMRSYTIWNKGGKTFIHTVKQSKYINFNFDSNQAPLVILYQTTSFWTSIWDASA